MARLWLRAAQVHMSTCHSAACCLGYKRIATCLKQFTRLRGFHSHRALFTVFKWSPFVASMCCCIALEQFSHSLQSSGLAIFLSYGYLSNPAVLQRVEQGSFLTLFAGGESGGGGRPQTVPHTLAP